MAFSDCTLNWTSPTNIMTMLLFVPTHITMVIIVVSFKYGKKNWTSRTWIEPQNFTIYSRCILVLKRIISSNVILLIFRDIYLLILTLELALIKEFTSRSKSLNDGSVAVAVGNVWSVLKWLDVEVSLKSNDVFRKTV